MNIINIFFIKNLIEIMDPKPKTQEDILINIERDLKIRKRK